MPNFQVGKLAGSNAESNFLYLESQVVMTLQILQERHSQRIMHYCIIIVIELLHYAVVGCTYFMQSVV